MRRTAFLRKETPIPQNNADRREAPRFSFYHLTTLKNISLVGGPELKLINISRHGALIEGQERMRSRSRLSLRFATTEGVYIIKGRIIRCNSYPTIEKVLRYRYAIAFDEDFTILHALLK